MKSVVVRLSLALIMSAVFSLPLPARADAPQIEGVTITNADVAQLLEALNTALKPNDSTIPIIVSVKAAKEMPSYDPRWHYAGTRDQASGVKAMVVWINSDLKGQEQQNAVASAFLLALTDGGYGGKAFKQLYDTAAAKDAQLPADAADPFLNRHRLAAALATLLEPKK